MSNRQKLTVNEPRSEVVYTRFIQAHIQYYD